MSEPSHRPLRIAVAGAGRMARQHLQVLRSIEGAGLVGVADPSTSARTDALRRFPDALGVDRLEAVLSRAEVDVVHVCTPMETHAEVAARALEAGCHAYVEKPVTPRIRELEDLLRRAGAAGRLLCGGHQLLFDPSYRSLLELLPAVGTPVHVESYFSFRPVRTGAGGGVPLTDAEQLIDVLSHPTYLLLDLMERLRDRPGPERRGRASAQAREGADPRRDEGVPELSALELSRETTVHALLRDGGLTGSLTVTLEGRPVDHWLRVTGTNGSVQVDFIRGAVVRLLGPGSSGIDKALLPFRHSAQLAVGSLRGLGRRALRRGPSYPGFLELVGAFHEAVRQGRPSPTSPGQLLGTVRVGEEVARAIEEREAGNRFTVPGPVRPPRVLVTGGTGLLGREVTRRLVAGGTGVRVVSRRIPPASKRVPGVEYRQVDLGAGVPSGLLEGIRAVVHCAAETGGGWEAHRRNSVEATRRLLEAAAASGASAFVHVSSVAVQAPSADGRPIGDEDPIDAGVERRGPYAWGKAESERVVRDLAEEVGIDVKVVRPLPLVDWAAFDPPGRLGRRVGNLYVAVGRPREPLAVAGVTETARAVAGVATDPSEAPPVMNLVPVWAPTRGDLVKALRGRHPEVRVLWLPRLLLVPLSWAAWLAQKLLRPGEPVVHLRSAFSSLRYEPGPAAGWMEREPVAGSRGPVGEGRVAS